MADKNIKNAEKATNRALAALAAAAADNAARQQARLTFAESLQQLAEEGRQLLGTEDDAAPAAGVGNFSTPFSAASVDDAEPPAKQQRRGPADDGGARPAAGGLSSSAGSTSAAAVPTVRRRHQADLFTSVALLTVPTPSPPVPTPIMEHETDHSASDGCFQMEL